jgi:hypothetical protein
MIKGAFVFFALAVSVNVVAQDASDEAAVKTVIDRLFMAMHKGDSTMLKGCFTNEVSLATIYRNEADPVISRENSIRDFMKSVGSPHKQIWYEEYWNLKILIDDDLASAWCDYAFFLDNTFSHCGVDAFHLHRGKDGWKIFHVSDTRRKGDCVVPEEIRKKH